MTVAVAIRASDAIVLAADTQVTVGADITDEPKVRTYPEHPSDGACIIAGSGSTGFIHALSDLMGAAFSREKWTDAESLVAIFDDVAANFQDKHVTMFSAYPANERPHVDLLITAQDRRLSNGVILRVEDGAASVPHPRYAAIGIGYASALSALADYKFPPRSCRYVCGLAVYAVLAAKQRSAYCGRHTTVHIAHQNGTPGWRGAMNIDEVDWLERDLELRYRHEQGFALAAYLEAWATVNPGP